MTQQPQHLKFGDRVRCKQTGAEGLIIDTGKTAVWILWEGQKCSNFYAYGTFEAVPHPDTERLDWLIKQNFNFQKCYDMSGRWWYEDNSFDKFKGTEGLDEREAIDKVMEKETEK